MSNIFYSCVYILCPIYSTVVCTYCVQYILQLCVHIVSNIFYSCVYILCPIYSTVVCTYCVQYILQLCVHIVSNQNKPGLLLKCSLSSYLSYPTKKIYRVFCQALVPERPCLVRKKRFIYECATSFTASVFCLVKIMLENS